MHYLEILFNMYPCKNSHLHMPSVYMYVDGVNVNELLPT